MKACFLPIGSVAGDLLPAALSAFSGGITEPLRSVSVFSVSESDLPNPVTGLLGDLNTCASAFSVFSGLSCLKTVYTSVHWRLLLPEAKELCSSDGFIRLVSALRGSRDIPALRDDADMAEWALRALLASGDGRCAPLFRFAEELRSCGDPDIRLMLVCDLCDPYSSGVASALLQWFRAALPDAFSGIVGLTRAPVSGRESALSDAKSVTASWAARDLVRVTDGRETRGADAAWVLGLPASFVLSDGAYRVLYFAAARIAARSFASASCPAPGLHTVSVPFALTLGTLGKEAPSAASFLLTSVWCLTDLFPSLSDYLERPGTIRSFAPASRNGFFRRLFRDAADAEASSALYAALTRAFKAILLEELMLIRSLPDPLRLSSREEELWQKAHDLCGHAVTLGSEYDVSRREAESSGVDKVHPVHRASLADTEEERLQRRLDDMSAQLDEALSERDAALSALGAFRGRQVLEDCASLCGDAFAAAEQKSGEPAESRSAIFARERRVRLLQAAVERCQSDLKAAAVFPAISRPASSRVSLQAPFSGEILDPDIAEACFRLLSASEFPAETASGVRDGIPGLFRGFRSPDAKTLFRSLAASLRSASVGDPAAALYSSVLQVCSEAVSPWRILTEKRLPDVPLLPDCAGTDRFLTVSALAERMLAENRANPVAACRGVMAALLLRQYRRPLPEDSVFEYTEFRKGSDPALNTWLEQQGTESATLVTCRKGSAEQALAVLIPGRCPVPVPVSGLAARLLPAYAVWFNRGSYIWTDPCPYLSESDRNILTEQLTRCRSVLREEGSRELGEFLREFYQDIVRTKSRSGEDVLLPSRLKAACALSSLKSWQNRVTRITACYDRSVVSDVFCSALTGKASFAPASCDVMNETVYALDGKPFARESSSALLESAGTPEEDLLLNTLDTECQLLSRSSDDYRDALTAGLSRLTDRYPDASAAARETAEALLHEASLPLGEAETTLSWPWDTDSPTVRTILCECLGDRLAEAALAPFSDLLAVFPARGGEILGDSLLSAVCVIDNAPSGEELPEGEPAPAKDAVLPPLSPAFAKALCRLPEGRTLLQSEFIKLERKPDGIFCVLTLQGAFPLRLCRTWPEAEIRSLYSHDLPTLALWPSVPFPARDWKAYFAYAHFRDSWAVSAVTEEETVPLSGESHRHVCRLEKYPLCFLLERNGASAGAVPNLLPAPESVSAGSAVACVDFGSSSTSVLLLYPEGAELFGGPSAVRLIISNPAVSRSLMKREFLTPDAFGAVIPSNVSLWTDLPDAGAVPFADGIICHETDPTELLKPSSGRLVSAFSVNDGSVRAEEIFLHELMLLAAFRVRIHGSADLSWRFSLPEDISREARERLMNLLRSLAEQVRLESGLFSGGKDPLLLACSESTAVGAYCRSVSPAEASGGLMTLDLGCRSVRMSLFTHNAEEAVRSCRISDGLSWVLLPSLLRDPSLLASDFGEYAVEPFRSDLASLTALLNKARSDREAFGRLLPAMEAMTVQYGRDLRTLCFSRMSEGRPTWTGALVLYFFCRIMMFSALDLLPAPTESSQRVLLPERMPVFVTGAGSFLFDSLSDYSRAAILRFLGMFRNPRILDIRLYPTPDRKLEVVSGLSRVTRMTSVLPDAPPMPVAVPVRPEELIPEFLLRFLSAFPAEAALLFPDFYTGDMYTPFTPRGQQLLSELFSRFRTEATAESPYILLSSWLSGLPELVRERY